MGDTLFADIYFSPLRLASLFSFDIIMLDTNAGEKLSSSMPVALLAVIIPVSLPTSSLLLEVFCQVWNKAGVPEAHDIIHHFNSTFLVMEDVPALSFNACATAAAVSWLLTCPILEDGKIGPIGGGRIQHNFFVRRGWLGVLHLTSSTNCSSTRQGIYTTASRLPGRPGRSLRTVTFANERLLIGHSDIKLDNFFYI
jgi:hypothetical protein